MSGSASSGGGTQDSGLLDVLVPLFEERTGYAVKTIAVGSGAALRLGEEGEADVILAHSPDAAEEFRRIAAAGAAFLSRGDESVTHTKELKIWGSAGVNPSGRWYQETGA